MESEPGQKLSKLATAGETALVDVLQKEMEGRWKVQWKISRNSPKKFKN